MQTFISRAGELFGSLFPLAEQPDDTFRPGNLVSDSQDEYRQEDRLPDRDESWYWAMHAHW